MATFVEKQVIEVQNVYESVPAWVQERLDRIERKLDQVLKREIVIMATLDETLVKVQQEATVDDSIIVLVNSMKAQLDGFLAGQLTPEAQQKVDALFSGVTDNIAKVSAAVVANTPAA